MRGLILAAWVITAATSSGCVCTARAGAGGTIVPSEGLAPEAAVTAGLGPGRERFGVPLTTSLEYLGGDDDGVALTFGAEVLHLPRPHGFRAGVRLGPLWTLADEEPHAVFVAEAAWIISVAQRGSDSDGIAIDAFAALSPERQGPGPWLGLRLSYESDSYWPFHGWP